MSEPEFDQDKIAALPAWRTSDHLDSDAMITAYLREILAEDQTDPAPAVLRAAIQSVIEALDKRNTPCTTA